MTICIAGIAENGEIVAVADKMLTIAGPVQTTYEITENNKTVEMNQRCIGLFAGNVVQGNSVLAKAKQILQQNRTKGASTAQVAVAVQDAYKETIRDEIDEQLLSRWGLTRAQYMDRKGSFDNNFCVEIDQLIASTNLGVDILIAGVDTVPRIYLVQCPGKGLCLDSVGYGCIGSGSQHAGLSLVESCYHRNLPTQVALHHIFEAKKRAEYDPGVGKQCDIILIKNSIRRLSRKQIGDMDNHYQRSCKMISGIKGKCAGMMWSALDAQHATKPARQPAKKKAKYAVQ